MHKLIEANHAGRDFIAGDIHGEFATNLESLGDSATRQWTQLGYLHELLRAGMLGAATREKIRDRLGEAVRTGVVPGPHWTAWIHATLRSVERDPARPELKAQDLLRKARERTLGAGRAGEDFNQHRAGVECRIDDTSITISKAGTTVRRISRQPSAGKVEDRSGCK